MADIFLKADATRLFKQKRVLFLGDSNIRALYKDFLQLMTSDNLISEKGLKAKLPETFRGDRLIKSSHLTKGREFEEERVLDNNEHYLHYAFITRCYHDRVESILKQIPSEIRPDVLIMNSCLWDITRWGPDGVDTYKENLQKLIQRLKDVLSPTAMVIWTTTLPVAQEIKGGFLIPQVEFMKYQLRYEVMEANFYTWQLFVENGFDVIDFHYHLQMQLTRRADDGVHWMPPAVRHMTNLVMTHVALAWSFPLPGRFRGLAVERKISGSLIPEINAPPLPPLAKSDASSKNDKMQPPTASPARGRNLKRSLSGKRKSQSRNRPIRSPSLERPAENSSPPVFYNYNHGYPDRRVAQAVRRLNRQQPIVSNIQRYLRNRNNCDVPIRAPWYK